MKLKRVAWYIENKLLAAGFTVHRYDAYSTNSIYLKLDYGACNSIRISDHNGKDHLSYKYNVNSNVNFSRWIKGADGKWKYFCTTREKDIDELIKLIFADRFTKKTMYNYPELIEKYKKQGEHSKGFWQQARRVRECWANEDDIDYYD